MSAAEQLQSPSSRTKDEVAWDLIMWHFHVDERIKKIYRILTDEEGRQDEPIKLLEVTEQAVETGQVDAFLFDPAGDITYSSVVALITPRELDLIRLKLLELPDGWSLDCAKITERPSESELNAYFDEQG